MDFFDRVLRAIQGWFWRKPSDGFNLDVGTVRSLQNIAEHEQRTPEEIANKILEDALRGHQAQEIYWARWQTLSPREQEITALVCLNYTSRQIASRLGISPETVKTYVGRTLLKFGARDRTVLRIMLKEWDFSAWDR